MQKQRKIHSKNPWDVLEIQVLLQSGFQTFVPQGEKKKSKKEIKEKKIILEGPYDFRGLAHSLTFTSQCLCISFSP